MVIKSVNNIIDLVGKKSLFIVNNVTFNPSSPKEQPPKQFSQRCSKTRRQGIKLLRVPLRSFFFLILAEKIELTTSPGGRVSFQNWDVMGLV